MTTYLRPGVYVQETLNPISPLAGPSSNTVSALVGANDRGPTVPTLVTSWGQYYNLFGSWNTVQSNNLPLAVNSYFQQTSAPLYVLRVTGSGASAATRVFQDTEGTPANTLAVSGLSAGTWGNNISVTITSNAVTGYFDLTVYYNGSVVESQWLQLTMTASDPRYALNIVNGNSNYIVLADSGSTATGATRNPAVQSTPVALTSGSDGSAVTSTNITSALNAFDTIPQSLVMNVPGYTDATTINNVIGYATGSTRSNDVFVVIDGENDTVANQLTLAASYTATSQAAVYYPQITVSDPTIAVGGNRSATKTIGAGAAVAGLYAATDASRGIFKAPAGLQARLAGAVSVPALSNANLDALNSASAPVNAIRYISGSGIVVMGARTLKPGYVDKYVPVRRSLIYIEKSLKDLTQFAIFEPNDAKLWARINASVSAFLTSFWGQGGLTGSAPSQAYFVICDATNNTPTTIDNGYVNIQVGVALQRPAEFIVINIGQYSGGTTVTVS